MIKLVLKYLIFDYIKLQQNSKCVISDSGTISESPQFLVSAIMIRAAHERPGEWMKGQWLCRVGENKLLILKHGDKQFESGITQDC